MDMERYNKIVQTFADYECQLLTTYEEYIESDKTKLKFKIIALCGHIVPNCWFHMFKYRGTGLLCKDCIDRNHKEHNKEIHATRKDINCYSLELENTSIELIKKYSDINIIEIHKTNECCLADIMIRVKGIDANADADAWLPIQVKSTLKGCHNVYSFGNRNNYPNMLIIFVCVEEEKFWIMDGNIVLNQCKISIGMQKSNKYSYYSVNKDELTKTLTAYYDIYNKDTFKNINTPQTPECVKEQEYKMLRESYLPNIAFINSYVNQQVFDFTVNCKKVQEKTAYYKNNNVSITLAKIAKRKNGKINQPYEIGDNDFYWINIPDKETFYVIPESILLQYDILYKENIKGTINLSFGVKNTWIIKYKYSYKDPDIENKINKIFNMKTI